MNIAGEAHPLPLPSVLGKFLSPTTTRRECTIECFIRRQGPPAASPICSPSLSRPRPLLLGPLFLLTLFDPPLTGRLYKVLNISCYCFTVSYSFILHPSPLHSFPLVPPAPFCRRAWFAVAVVAPPPAPRYSVGVLVTVFLRKANTFVPLSTSSPLLQPR